MKSLRRLACFFVAFLLGFGCASAFAAGLAQDGRQTSSANVDGTSAGIVGHSFNPANNQCALYSTLLTDFTASRQVETGLVRCDSGFSIDGTCLGGHTFAEKATSAGTYYCNQGNSFSNGTRYNAIVSRDTSTSISGVIAGTSIAQGGMDNTHDIRATSWGEATGGSSCPSSSPTGSIKDWNRLLPSGWAAATGSVGYHNGNLSPCWTVASINSTGDFNVN